MAGEITIPLVGNLVADPIIRETQTGVKVANFRIAVTPRRYDATEKKWVDGEATFLSCTAWRNLAEHIGASLTKGAQVVAIGRLSQREYEKDDGTKVTTYEVEVEQLGASLMFATAVLTRTSAATSGADAAFIPEDWTEVPAASGSAA